MNNNNNEELLNNTVQQQENRDNISISEEDISSILADNGYSESVENNNNNQQNTDEELYQEAPINIIEEETDSHDNNEELEVPATTHDSPTEDTSQDSNEKIPLNSPTLLIDNSTSRFSGTEWFSEIQKKKVIIAGVGGIGSNVAFQIARMVPASMVLYDDDTVESSNMAGQLYNREDVGRFKVDAIASKISLYTSLHQVYSIREKYTSLTENGDIMICGFDSMLARKVFFNSWLKGVSDKHDEEEKSKCLYLDGRLSIDTLQVLCIRGDDTYNIERYKEEFLFRDYEADETICSMKQTTYLACMIGSVMTNLFTNFVANSLNPVIPYDLPFFTEYDAQNMIFKTEN